jgi:REP element-mobilizing transposase RayT
MTKPPFLLDGPRRRKVLEAIQEVCATRAWELFAVHVRTNHVHAMVEGPSDARGMIRDFKVIATRKLRAIGLGAERVWGDCGSYRQIKEEATREQILTYLREGQGEKMEFWTNDHASGQSHESHRR